MKRHTCFTVLGKPFFSIGGQLHNSSGYALGAESGRKYEEDVKTAFDSLKALGANTVAVPVCWDAFEPEEGKFDIDYVRRMIDRIRQNDLHAVLLWFGTWKNGQMESTRPHGLRQTEGGFGALCAETVRRRRYCLLFAGQIRNRISGRFAGWLSS